MNEKKIGLLVIGPRDLPALRRLQVLDAACEISVSDVQSELVELAGDAEVLLVAAMAPSISLAALWKHASRVRWIHSLGAGVEKLLFPALIESPVPLTNARGVFKRSLAEFAVLGILFHTKHVRRLLDQQRERRWQPLSVDWANNKTLGVVGYGEIGRECALLAKGMGLKIHALRRTAARPDDALVDRAYRSDELHQMLRGVDVLLCAAPLTPATHHMIGAAEFDVMKPSAIIINVGRGPVIDEAALVSALQAGKIAAASLDVFEHEPLPATSPLWAMTNVLISPHCTDQTQDPDWLDLSMQLFIENFERYRTGVALVNIVDKVAGY
jgi:phosphoglycerate dehydrogenase-like enzyme